MHCEYIDRCYAGVILGDVTKGATGRPVRKMSAGVPASNNLLVTMTDTNGRKNMSAALLHSFNHCLLPGPENKYKVDNIDISIPPNLIMVTFRCTTSPVPHDGRER